MTNALSTRLDVTVWRDGKVAELGFADGDVVKPLEVRPATRSDKKSGTRVRAWANPKYFDSPKIVAADIAEILLWVATRPPHVNIDEMLIKPVDQADIGKVFRRMKNEK